MHGYGRLPRARSLALLLVSLLFGCGGGGGSGGGGSSTGQPGGPPFTVSITAPQSCDAAGGVTISVAGQGGAGAIARVDVSVGGSVVASITTGPFVYSFVAPASAGTLVVDVRAVDTTGTVASAEAEIQVRASAPNSPPSVTLYVPREVTAGALLSLSAQASADRGLAQVIFQANGATLSSLQAPPFTQSFAVPASTPPGTQLAFGVIAVDSIGRQTAASAVGSVVAANAPDTEPPTIDGIAAPAVVAAGASFTVLVSASDNRGVAEVDLGRLDGSTETRLASLGTPPYSFSLTAPSTAGTLTLVVHALDAAGNAASQQVSITVQASFTPSPPSVTLGGPDEVPQGGQVALVASAQDQVGITRVVFSQGLSSLGTRTAPPYTLTVSLPAGARAGDTIGYLATASNAAGLSAVASKAVRVAAPGNGVVTGEVFGMEDGGPLAGATVEVIGAPTASVTGAPIASTSAGAGGTVSSPVQAGSPSSTTQTSNENGRFSVGAPSGAMRLRITSPGRRVLYRTAAVPSGGAASVASVRLERVTTAPTTVSALAGGTVQAAAAAGAGSGGAALVVAPGSLVQDAQVYLATLSLDALPELLPRGWSPAVACEVGPPSLNLGAGAELRIPNLSALGSGDPVVVRYDEGGRWRRVRERVSRSANDVTAVVRAPGIYAIVLLDPAPGFSPPPSGDALDEAADARAQGTLAATIFPSNPVIVSSKDSVVDVRIEVSGLDPAPTGTLLRLDTRESYLFSDGSALVLRRRPRRLPIYRRTGDVVSPGTAGVAHLRLAPERGFGPEALASGKIDLFVYDAAILPPPEPIGPSGGTAALADGTSLTIAAGALPSPTAVELVPESATALPLALPPSFRAVSGVEIAAFGLSVTAPATLSLPALGEADGAAVLLELIESRDRSAWSLLGDTTISSGRAVTAVTIHDGSIFALARSVNGTGIVAGTVRRGSQPVQGAVVTADGSSIASVSGSDGSFRVSLPAGAAHIRALFRPTGEGADAMTSVIAGQTASLDLALTSPIPQVITVTPQDGAVQVSLGTSVILSFSTPIDPRTLGAAVTVSGPSGTAVAVDSQVLPGGLSAVIQPRALLQPLVSCRVNVSSSLMSTAGVAFSSFQSRFQTLSTTPPPRPAAGQIRMSIPDITGVVTISGSQGTTNPGTAVIALNNDTGATTTVLSGSDGSFSVSVTGAQDEKLSIVLRDPSGQQTLLSPAIFDDGKGTAIVTSRGGTMFAPDGAQITFDPGAIDKPVTIRYEPFIASQSPFPIPPSWTEAFGVTFAAGFKLTPSRSVKFKLPLRLRFPPTQGTYRDGDQFLVCEVPSTASSVPLSATSTPVLPIEVDIGVLRNGAIEDPGLLDLIDPTYYITLGVQYGAIPFSSVHGRVLTAPRTAEVQLTAPNELFGSATSRAHVVASARAIAPGWQVSGLVLSRPNGSIVATTDGGAIDTFDPVNIGSQPVNVLVLRAVLGVSFQSWGAVATFTTPEGAVVTAVATASTELVVNPSSVSGSTHDSIGYYYGLASRRDQFGNAIVDNTSIRPARDVDIELDNGIGIGYPAAARTNEAGEFLLGMWLPGSAVNSTTPYSIRVIDPLTGQFTRIPFTPVFGKFVNMGDVFIPASFGNTSSPTLNIQVTGEFVVGKPLEIKAIAHDREALDGITVSVNNARPPMSTRDGAGQLDYTFTVPYTPIAPGTLPIHATVTSRSGNWVERETDITIRQPATAVSGQVAIGGAISLQPGSREVDPSIGVYVEVSSNAPVGTDLDTIQRSGGQQVFFLDPFTNARCAAVGSVVTRGRLRFTPAQLLPFNTDLELHVSGTVIPFTTSDGTLMRYSTSSSFGEIRSIAVSDKSKLHGTVAYVADFKNAQVLIYNVDPLASQGAYGPHPLEQVSWFDFPARPRALAISSHDPNLEKVAGKRTELLVVVGGGGNAAIDPSTGQGGATGSTNVLDSGTLPILKVYDITNPPRSFTDPVLPTLVASVILEQNAWVGIPVTVRVKGKYAYVCEAGAGLQVVDLEQALKDFQSIQRGGVQARLFALNQKGETAIVDGFRLPDQSVRANAPLFGPFLGTPFDAALDIPGLIVTGGASGRLYVLGASGLSFIPTPDPPAPPFGFQTGISRLLASADFITAAADGNGNTIYQNVQLVAASDGAGISLVDLSSPSKPVALGRADMPDVVRSGGTVQEMAMVRGYIFSGDRLVNVLDPTNPSVSKPIGGFTSGGKIAISRGGLHGREILALSASAARTSLQLAAIRPPAGGRDWNLVRTAHYDSHVTQDNQEYLNLGDPVNPFTGEFVLTRTDLTIPGRHLDFSFTRTYRSQIEYDGALGQGWDFNYDERLTFDADSLGVLHYDGAGRVEVFTVPNASATEYKSPRGVFSVLRRIDPPGGGAPSFSLTDRDGTVHRFEPSLEDPEVHFRLASIDDRYDNQITFNYRQNARGRDELTTITDSMGRTITLSYDLRGRLTSLTDFTDRTIRYGYDYDDNLVSVTTPPVLPDFPSGKTTTYGYSGGYREWASTAQAGDDVSNDDEPRIWSLIDADGVVADPTRPAPGQPPRLHPLQRVATARLNHNLTSITDPKGQTYLTLEYSQETDPHKITFDRVVRQRLGGNLDGGWYTYSYYPDNGPVPSPRCEYAITTNRSTPPHATTRYYTANGELDHVTEDVTIDGAPRSLTEEMTYTNEGLVKSSKSPRGLVTTFTYDEGNPDRNRQADVVDLRIDPVPGAPATTGPRVRTVLSRGAFGVPTQTRDELGNVTVFEVDDRGNVKTVTRPQVQNQPPVIERFTYKPCGYLDTHTASDNTVTTYSYRYDPRDFPDGGPGYLQSTHVTGAGNAPPLDLTTTITMDSVGNQRVTIDPRGLETDYTVNALNQVEKVVEDPSGMNRVRLLHYDENDNLDVTDNTGIGGSKVTRQFSTLNQVIQATEVGSGTQPLSRTTGMTYTPNEEPYAATTPLGRRTLTTYDERSLPIQVDNDVVSSSDPSGTVTSSQNDRGRVSNRSYDEDGHLAKLTAPAGSAGQPGTTTYAYDGFNEVASVTDPNGNVVEYDYDARGLVIEERRKDGQGALVKRTHTDRDALGRPSTVTEYITPPPAAGQRTSITKLDYDAGSRLAKITNAFGVLDRTRSWAYDGLGRVVDELDAAGDETKTTYADNNGADVSSVTVLEVELDRSSGPGTPTMTSTTTVFRHDKLGRLLLRYGPSSTEAAALSGDRKVELQYQDPVHRDVVSKVLTTIAGSTQDVVTFGYDGFSRRTTVTHGTNVVETGYDDDDLVVSLTNPDDPSAGLTMGYDGRARPVRVLYGDGSFEDRTYFLDNTLKTSTDRAVNELDYTYDMGRRLKAVNVRPEPGFEGTNARTFTYDPLDRIIGATVADTYSVTPRELGLQYDSRGALLAETQAGRAVASEYDVLGQRSKLTYPLSGRALTFDYTPVGRIDTIHDPGFTSYLAQFDFSGPALRLGARYGNRTRGRRSFNDAREESSRKFTDPSGNTLSQFTYGRDGRGRITGVERSAPPPARGSPVTGDSFSYKPEDWLGEARLDVTSPLDPGSSRSTPATVDQVYDYDARGNRRSRTENGVQKVFTTNDLNQYSQVNGATLAYDKNGNLRSDGRFNYEYDAFNQLRRVKDAATAAEVVHFEYDAMGRRVREVRPAATEEYIYDGPNVVEVLDGSRRLVREYVHEDAIDHPIAMRTGGIDTFYQEDGTGSVVALTDARGQVVERYRYDPFGRATILEPDGVTVRSSSSFGNRRMWKGLYLDPDTGLYCMRAREYSPELGRFLQTDPAGAVDGLNLYTFAGGDPVDLGDPTGLFRQASAQNPRLDGVWNEFRERVGYVFLVQGAYHLAPTAWRLAKGVAGLPRRLLRALASEERGVSRTVLLGSDLDELLQGFVADEPRRAPPRGQAGIRAPPASGAEELSRAKLIHRLDPKRTDVQGVVDRLVDGPRQMTQVRNFARAGPRDFVSQAFHSNGSVAITREPLLGSDGSVLFGKRVSGLGDFRYTPEELAEYLVDHLKFDAGGLEVLACKVGSGDFLPKLQVALSESLNRNVIVKGPTLMLGVDPVGGEFGGLPRTFDWADWLRLKTGTPSSRLGFPPDANWRTVPER